MTIEINFPQIPDLHPLIKNKNKSHSNSFCVLSTHCGPLAALDVSAIIAISHQQSAYKEFFNQFHRLRNRGSERLDTLCKVTQ